MTWDEDITYCARDSAQGLYLSTRRWSSCLWTQKRIKVHPRTIAEGKFHQVKRMVACRGKEADLQRLDHGRPWMRI